MTEDVREAIRLLELQLLDPGIRRSAEHLHALLDDGFIEFGLSGRVYDKMAAISQLPEQPARTFEMDGFEIQMLAPGTVLATYRVRSALEGSSDRESSLRSSIWRERHGTWRLVFHQGTPSA